MAIPGTVQITGQLAPTAITDTYPTHEAVYGLGGLRSVADHTARNAITTDRREQGMVVVTNNDGLSWMLLAGPWSGVDADWTAYATGGGTGPAGPANAYHVDIFSGEQSTQFDGTNKRTCGRIYFDPTAAKWNLSGTSTATLYMILETTNASFTAAGDLYQQTGTGSPATVAAVTPTAGTTAQTLSVDVSAAFKNTSNAGIFVARAWITTANGTDQATCSGAWIDIKP